MTAYPHLDDYQLEDLPFMAGGGRAQAHDDWSNVLIGGSEQQSVTAEETSHHHPHLFPDLHHAQLSPKHAVAADMSTHMCQVDARNQPAAPAVAALSH